MIKIAIPKTIALSILAKCKDCANVLVRRREDAAATQLFVQTHRRLGDEEEMHPNCENIPTGQSQEKWFLENLSFDDQDLCITQILCKSCVRRGEKMVT